MFMTTKQALDWYTKFGGKPNHVATVPSIITLCRILKKKPQKILEVGAGQGTLTKLILERSTASVDAYEEIPELRERLSKLGPRVRVVTYDQQAAPPYDLVIIDGPGFKIGRAEFTYDIAKRVGASVYFIEGRRDDQRRAIVRAAKEKGCAVRLRPIWGRYVEGEFHKAGCIITLTPANRFYVALTNYYAKTHLAVSLFCHLRLRRFQ
jgi:Ribosomal RNA adenine dimethylase